MKAPALDEYRTAPEVAEIIGLTPRAVRSRADALGITSRLGRRIRVFSPADVARLKAYNPPPGPRPKAPR